MVGAARVAVIALEPLRVRVVRGSGVVEGHEHEPRRCDVFLCASPREHAAFGDAVRRIWAAR